MAALETEGLSARTVALARRIRRTRGGDWLARPMAGPPSPLTLRQGVTARNSRVMATKTKPKTRATYGRGGVDRRRSPEARRASGHLIPQRYPEGYRWPPAQHVAPVEHGADRGREHKVGVAPLRMEVSNKKSRTSLLWR